MTRTTPVIIGVLAAIWWTAPAAAADPELDRVLAALKRRQEQATVVRIRADGAMIAPKGSDTERFGEIVRRKDGQVSPPSDLKFDKKQDFLIDYPNRRFRRLNSEEQDGKLESYILAYDGAKSYGSRIDIPIDRAEGLRPTGMSIHSGGKNIDFFNSEWWPYFLCHGFILTRQGQKYFWSDLRVPIDPEEVYLIRRESFRGQACAVLRTFPVGEKGRESCNEYRVAFDDGAVRQMTTLLGNQKDIEITIDYRREGGRISPTQWKQEWFAMKSQKAASWESFKVTHVEFDTPVTDATFTLSPAAGVVVTGRQHADNWDDFQSRKGERTKVYQADESGRLIEGELVGGEFKPSRHYLWWIVGTVVGLILVVVVGVAYRTRRGRKVAPLPPISPPRPTGGP